MHSFKMYRAQRLGIVYVSYVTEVNRRISDRSYLNRNSIEGWGSAPHISNCYFCYIRSVHGVTSRCSSWLISTITIMAVLFFNCANVIVTRRQSATISSQSPSKTNISFLTYDHITCFIKLLFQAARHIGHFSIWCAQGKQQTKCMQDCETIASLCLSRQTMHRVWSFSAWVKRLPGFSLDCDPPDISWPILIPSWSIKTDSPSNCRSWEVLDSRAVRRISTWSFNWSFSRSSFSVRGTLANPRSGRCTCWEEDIRGVEGDIEELLDELSRYTSLRTFTPSEQCQNKKKKEETDSSYLWKLATDENK